MRRWRPGSLAQRRQQVGVPVIGGGSLLFLGIITRPTADVDVLGFSTPEGYVKVKAVPEFLSVAVREVGEALGLGEAWLNTGPAGIIDVGLPLGLEDRVTVRHYGALEVHLPAREDQVCLKLYAAVDQGERSKHFATCWRSHLHGASCWMLVAGRGRMTHRRASSVSCDASSGYSACTCPMATSRARRRAATFTEQSRALAWGAWTELGVSGWTATHTDWAIDPEPLILFTAWLGDRDPRLRDGATDWCIRSWRYISRVRLKNLLRLQPDDVHEAFGEFAATVATHAGVTWPGASEPRRYTLTGRSTLPPLTRPPLAWLRLRAMFGVGARSEILRHFLAREPAPSSIAGLASTTGYTKRNIADECDILERAGVLAVRQIGNRFSYSLARRPELEAFVGELPAVRPNWTAILNVARELVLLEERVGSSTLKTLPVHTRRTLRAIEEDLDELGISTALEDVTGANLWPAVRQVGKDHLGAWSIGRWPDETTAANKMRRLIRRAQVEVR